MNMFRHPCFYAHSLPSSSSVLKFFHVSKHCFEMKMTKLGVGHFTIISGHFFTNYNYRFHKTEILMVILKGLTCQNLKRIKSYDTNHKFICNWKFTSHKWPTEIQTVILRCLVSQHLNQKAMT